MIAGTGVNGVEFSKALGHLSPLQAMKNWYQKQPKRFNKRVYNLAGLDKR